ncbi:MAG: hypothetical protein MUF04_06080, partial [Akkermansiaceae bacterium]|nr:hypothetical protein [Akkermansiaceae bacterium]
MLMISLQQPAVRDAFGAEFTPDYPVADYCAVADWRTVRASGGAAALAKSAGVSLGYLRMAMRGVLLFAVCGLGLIGEVVVLNHAADGPLKIGSLWVVFKRHLDSGYTRMIDEVLKRYREGMMEWALMIVDATRGLPNEQRFSWTLAGWPLSHALGPRQD